MYYFQLLEVVNSFLEIELPQELGRSDNSIRTIVKQLPSWVHFYALSDQELIFKIIDLGQLEFLQGYFGRRNSGSELIRDVLAGVDDPPDTSLKDKVSEEEKINTLQLFMAQIGDMRSKSMFGVGMNKLLKQAETYDSQRVPGSTVVVLFIRGDRGALVWVGDSRIYRRRDHVVEQLTRDHSHVQDLVEQGVILESEAESHPMANVITRAVGISEPLELDTKLINVRADDQFLLCSDGLSRLVTNDELESMMANKDSEEVTQSLLHTMNIYTL